MLGVQTIGNATLIAYDNDPILSTDPWMGGDHYAYFGSWHLPYDIPNNIKEDIIKSKYIWFSHGHPDHINHDSLNLFKNNKILISEHFGARIFKDLRSENFNVTVLKDREWTNLSENISIMSITTNTQDSILLLRVKNDIFVNLNDAGLYSSKFIKKQISKFRRKFLLSISSFEADMLNFFDQDNNFIKPAIADKFSAGEYLSMLANVLGAKYIIPFSTFHEYQREDSIWVNEYIYPIKNVHEGISNKHVYIKPFSFINSEKDDDFQNTDVKKRKLEIKSPSSFGDNWKDELNIHDKKIVEDYFNKFSSYRDKIGFISFVIGGKELNLKFNGPKDRGISFELPRNSLITACKYKIFDDLLIGNFMKTKLYNLNSLYDPKANFTHEICKFGDNGEVYSQEELDRYKKYYAKKMGKEYFFDLFANTSKDHFKYFFKNYRNSKYYTQVKKIYYYLFK
mgnify:CR=1 FL=1|tara:strand:- start:289 stop:1650 length:1362 start_codon:yes stop_codon:yes gene_type:complete